MGLVRSLGGGKSQRCGGRKRRPWTTGLSSPHPPHMSDADDFARFNRAPASRPATWHKKDPSEWNFAQKSFMFLDILQDPPHSERPPVAAKTDPVPVYPVWRQHVWILPRLLPPLLVHRVIMQTTGITFPPLVALVYYSASFLFFGVSLFQMIRRMGKKYGFVSGAVRWKPMWCSLPPAAV